MKIVSKKLKINNTSDICFTLLFVMLSIFLFWKSQYGYVNADEAFYLTVPYRLFQKDALFLDEWNTAQMSGFLTYPFVFAFIKLTGGTTGIYLFVRYIYVIFKMLITLYVYYVFRKLSYWGAVFSALVFMIFAGCGLQVLSYNSWAAGGLLVCLLLLWDCKKCMEVKCVLAGVALSVAVLGIPTLAVLYFLYGISVLYCQRQKEKKFRKIHVMLTWKAFLLVTAGIAIMMIAFFGFVFSRISLGQMIETIPNLLLDPGHRGKKIWKVIPGYLARIALGNNHNWYIFSIYSGIAVMFLWVFISNKRGIDKRREKYAVVLFLVMILLMTYNLTDGYINHTVFTLNVVSPFFLFLSRDKRVLLAFSLFYVPAMIFTFLEYIVSNTGFSGISMTSCVAGTGSCLMIIMVYEELKGNECSNEKHRKLFSEFGLRFAVSAFLILFSATLMYQRYNYIFWEGPMAEQTQRLTEGPQAGLLVSEEKELRYLAELEDIKEVCARGGICLT